jgi:DNA-binding response OmpR family regulator
MRRRRQQEPTEVYTFGSYTLNVPNRSLSQNGQDVPLSPKEFKLIEYFVKNAGRALTRDALLNAVWGYNNFVTSRSVDRCVTTLRNKIESDTDQPEFIHTIREIGYKLEVKQP